MLRFLILIVYACMSVGGLTCFKLGNQQAMSMSITRTAFSVQVSWLSILGICMYIGSFLIYLGLVSRIQLGYLTPISSAIVYILTMCVSLMVFKEHYSMTQLLGMALILAGVVLMNMKR